MNFLDRSLNSITMYKLVLYGLIFLVLVSFVLAITHNLAYEWSVTAMILSLVVLGISAYISNFIFSKIFSVPVNSESYLITALILFLILPPTLSPNGLLVLALAGTVAMASKFLLAARRKHIFNPAAFSAFVLYATNLGEAVWWVSAPAMLPFVFIVGMLVVRKIRRFSMFLAFIGTWLVFSSFTDGNFGLALFLGTIMLTEPITTPGTRKSQIVYGAMAGILLNIGLIPEMVLLISNVFSYLTSLRKRVLMSLIEKKKIAKDIYEFVFSPDGVFSFKSGQYLEWTLAHEKPDLRGNRRFFTIASSPTENEIKLGVKFNELSSSFKKSLLELEGNKTILAGQLGGDFVLPSDQSKKLVFLAGGIGVTPFRSMIKYLLDKSEKRDITLFYSVKSEEEIAYKEIFTEAESKIGLKVNYIVGQIITRELIEREVKDFKNCIYYISGPERMADAFKKMLRSISIPRSRIITDYFPGFA